MGDQPADPQAFGWRQMFQGEMLGRSVLVASGISLFAINAFLVTTILPTAVRDIGGLRFFAWNTTFYVVASLFGAALLPRLLHRLGGRYAYHLALLIFIVGSSCCATSGTMIQLLAGRTLQGVAAGLLSALSYTMVRALFPPELWSRGVGLISASWGIATLAGPAVGGVFAQNGSWHLAFWLMAAIAAALIALVELALPRKLPDFPPPKLPLAYVNLVVLAASVLTISAISTMAFAGVYVAGLVLAGCGFVLFIHLERSGSQRLLPHRAWNPGTPLGATYTIQALLLIAVSTEIFVPYFLQTLYGLQPLAAGYLSAMMAAGWITSAMVAPSAGARRAAALQQAGPWLITFGLGGLSLLMPASLDPPFGLCLIAVCLMAMGIGMGTCWPLLSARVFAVSDDAERDLAASTISVVVMVSSALGSALAGMITNVAGLTRLGGVEGATHASSWLFAMFMAAPLTAIVLLRRMTATQSSASG